MSDLRTRIAAVLEAADNDWAVTDTYLGMADAVIAQLGLHIDSPANGWLQAKTAMWKADDGSL
jgi:hypothetical protein